LPSKLLQEGYAELFTTVAFAVAFASAAIADKLQVYRLPMHGQLV
jgi:hypothetical protein